MAAKMMNPMFPKGVVRGAPKRKTGPKSPLKQLVLKADKLFSEYIRRRDSDEYGYANCVTCGDHMNWKMMECGHWITRSQFATRYDERNAHIQCFKCNRQEGGMGDIHLLRINEIHGEGTTDQLQDKGFEAKTKRYQDWYEALIKTLKILVAREQKRIGDNA